MGCTESLFKKKPTTDEAADAAGVDGDLKNGDSKAAAKAEAKAAKAAAKSAKAKDKKKGKEEKAKEAGKDGETTAAEVKNGSTKTGANSAKVRPLTPTPPAGNQNVPKPVSFDVPLEGGQAELPEVQTPPVVADSGYRLKLPRKLPKLSSYTSRKELAGETDSPITSEAIQEKQRKAEEKRQEILEEKKQKARKFVEKFGNSSGSKSASGASSMDEGDEDEELNEEALGGMHGLDSGLGLDGYGLEGDVKADDTEEEVRGLTRVDTASSAPVVVQDGPAEVAA